ncbi:MAG TPA: wax ester/triacylglycerol synthase family O-acyltransferase [Telluria sp.]|nr:wax ester/triacylglycerol synthase family O-acyltransferase [Telluria sp.]
MQDVREPLGVVDHAWLRMDRPTNHMMVCGVMIFAARLTLDEVRDTVRTRLLCFHRFRQRVVFDGGTPFWETDANFDLDWHVVRVGLPAPGGETELRALVGSLVSTALPPDRPMWQFHLIDRPAGSVVVLRIHHCYGDGFALLHVMQAMTQDTADKPSLPPTDVVPMPAPRTAAERVFGPLTEMFGDGVRLAGSALGTVVDWVRAPAHAMESVDKLAGLALATGVIAAMPPDAPTRFKGDLGPMKGVAWADPISLKEVKAVGAALSISVNDILLACLTGALRRYLLEQGDPVQGAEVRALVPVNLRPPGPVQELGNRFGLVFFPFPLEEADPVIRAREVHRRMLELKQSQQALVALGILAVMGMAPDALRESILTALAANATLVVTNVHGPAQGRYFAGHQIERQMFWVPQSGGIGIGVSILSYAGQVHFGVVADKRRVPDPDTLADMFAHEFEVLLLACMLTPAASQPKQKPKRRPKRV